MEKVIFLDIDGPMIPTTSFLFDEEGQNCSYEQRLDERCVKVLRKIIDKSGARIVFNTTHNTMLDGQDQEFWNSPGLRQRFREAGFGNDLHERDHTDYPDLDRTTAINKWIKEGGYQENELLWVAFDDARIDHKRAYLTNSDLGIGLGEYAHAAHYLQFKKKVIL